MFNIMERPKSSRRTGEISRFEAHDYEKTIQTLLEKIEKLESKLILVCKDKYDAINDKDNFENENKNLLLKLESENEKNIELSNINKEKEKRINNLQIQHKSLMDLHNIDVKNFKNEINSHKSTISNLNKTINSKNDLIKNYSVDNKFLKQSSDNFKNLFQSQINLNQKQNNQIINLESTISDYSLKKRDEAALLLEIELLKKDNLRLLNLLNTTDDYRDFCHLGLTAPLGIRYIKPVEEKKEEKHKPISKKEERERSLKEYKKYMANKKKKLEKEDRNWVPLEAYNFLVESKNKYKLDLNNDVIENLLHILNNFWKERLEREINKYRTAYQNEIKELKRRLQSTASNDLLVKTSTNFEGNTVTNRFTKTASSNLLGKISANYNNLNNNQFKEDYFFKAAINSNNKRLESEIEMLKKKLEEKDNKDKKKRNKIYNQGNLLMTQKIIDEVENLKNKINSLYKQYEEKVKFSIDNYENSEFKNKIMDESVKSFFSSIILEISNIERKIENWKFNIQVNISGIDYAMKNN